MIYIFEVLYIGLLSSFSNFLPEPSPKNFTLFIFVLRVNVIFDFEVLCCQFIQVFHSFVKVHLLADDSANQIDDCLLFALIER